MTQRSIYQNLDPTLNGYHPDWYDKNAKLISRKPGCSVISYQCNGTGILYDYSIFPGIDLIFMDFNCSDIFDEPNEMRNVLEIRHYQEGRVEFEFEGDKVFEKLIQNKTVIMIAHRLSTIRNADQILVMEHGQLIEQGTHDTLMERQGKYTQMWNSYMESISWKIRAGKGGAIE